MNNYKINYGNNIYTIIATNYEAQELVLILQDSNNKTYKISAKNVILYYYNNKAKQLLTTIKDLSELIKIISDINLMLNNIPEYKHIKSLQPDFSIKSEDIKPIVSKIYETYNLQHNSKKNQQMNQPPRIINSEVNNQTNTQLYSEVSEKRKQELGQKSIEELIMLLQLYPNNEENDFIRYLIKSKESTKTISITGNDSNPIVQQPKTLQKRIRPNGYVVDNLIILFSGIVLGISLMTIISLLTRL